MISYNSSKNILKKGIIKIKDEKIKSINSLNRVSSSNIYSTINYPTGDNAAFDGFAINSKDTKSIKKKFNQKFKIIGSIAAGVKPFKKRIGKFNAVEIMTGAIIPKGFDTMVGERGQMLSGGQQQRIAIARTIVRNPDIIIFDEATSSLDSNTELLIKNAINVFSKNKTSIIIAHRLSTIKDADRIIFLKNGYIVEDGTHAKLISKNGLYAEYYNKQWMDYFK